jgi:hypothetical protein
MEVRAAGVISVVEAGGPQLNQSETVTMFNDLCVLAPAALLDAPVIWEEVDARSTRAIFTNAGHTIRAELVFDDAGDLVDFVSDDRFQTSDGTSYRRYPWSTPLRDYRRFAGGMRVAARGAARWLTPQGELSYGRFEIVDIEYNVTTR